MTSETKAEAIRELVSVLEEFDQWALKNGLFGWTHFVPIAETDEWQDLIARAKAALKKAGAL